MYSFKDSLAYWTTVLGTVVAFFGMIQSFTWLAGIGALLVAGSIIAIAYGRKQRDLLNLAALRIDGRSIDSLNLASLRRRLNRSLVIQEAQNVATIRGEDLTISWQCAGYCRAEQESAIEFSIDADNNIPFGELECVAYDLHNDPGKNHKIRPILLGPDGISKKIAVPFLAPLVAQQPFNVALTCELPGCMKAGVEYYTASLSFEQDRVHRYVVQLNFEQDLPKWLRVYERDASGVPRLVRDLPPTTVDREHAMYRDIAEELPAQTARIYVFRRDHILPKSA